MNHHPDSTNATMTRLKLQKTKAASVEQGNNRYARWTKTRVPAEYGIFIVMSDGTQGQVAKVKKTGDPEWSITAEIAGYGQGTSIHYHDVVNMFHKVMASRHHAFVNIANARHSELSDVREFVQIFNFEEFGIED